MADDCSVVVCTTCRPAGTVPQALPQGDPPGEALSQALLAAGVAHQRQACLAACSRGCVVALRGQQRWSFVLGGLDPDRDLEALLIMIRAWRTTPDGLVPWRERPEVIRKNTIVRIPPPEVSDARS